jgi:hypothetical protein
VRECESNWWAARRPRVSGCVEVLQVEVGGSVFNLIGFVVSSLKFGVQGFGSWFWVWGLRFGVWYLPELLHDAQVFPRLRIVPLNLGRGLQGSIELVKPQAVQGAEGEAARYACRGRAIACESYFLVPQKSSQAGLSFWPARQVRDLSQPLG